MAVWAFKFKIMPYSFYWRRKIHSESVKLVKLGKIRQNRTKYPTLPAGIQVCASNFAKSFQQASSGDPELFNTSGLELDTNPFRTFVSATCKFSFLLISPIWCFTKPTLCVLCFFFLQRPKLMPVPVCARWVLTSACHAGGGAAGGSLLVGSIHGAGAGGSNVGGSSRGLTGAKESVLCFPFRMFSWAPAKAF
jgi:hypothetical protein